MKTCYRRYAEIGLKFSKKYIENLFTNSPFYAQWETLFDCNLRCVFCNVWKTKTYAKNTLDTKGCLKLVDELAKAGIIFLGFTGGEPLLRKDFPEIIRHARDKGMYTMMNCNGTLLMEKVNEIKDYIDTVHVSLDSADPGIHNRLRGRGYAFQKTVEGIKAARTAGMKLALNMTVTKDNFDGVEDMVKLAADLGVDSFLTPVSAIPTEGVDASKAKDVLVDNEIYVQKIKSLKKRYKHIKTANVYLDFVKNGGFDNFQCLASKVMLNIKPDGSLVLPCGYFPTYRFGREDKTVKDIINSHEYKEKTKMGGYNFCKQCTLSCFFIPSALMHIRKISSMLKSYT